MAMTCPKCGTDQPEAPACRRCGLAADRMASFRSQSDAETPAHVVAAWTAVDAAWDDPTRHEKFVAAVVEAGAFPYAARQYRAAAAARPDDAVAKTQLERVGKMAEAALRATATQKPEKGQMPYRNATVVLVACIIAIVFAVAYALLRKAQDANDGEMRPAPAPTRPAHPPR